MFLLSATDYIIQNRESFKATFIPLNQLFFQLVAESLKHKFCILAEFVLSQFTSVL